MQFDSLGLNQALLTAVAEKGYTTPSPIQLQAIPAVLSGSDVMAAAQTGTGKTAGFTLPLLHRLSGSKRVSPNHIKALVLTPTRELAAQVAESVNDYGKHLNLTSKVVFGGVKINPQMMALRKGVDILIATPGRLLDLYQQNAVRFDELEVLILDEADRMLDMGFIHDIKRLLKLMPKKRQNLLFSATFSDEIRELAKGIVNKPVEISVAPANTTAESIEQWVYPTDKSQKPKLLLELIKSNNWYQVLVFSKTKHGANKLTKFLDTHGVSAVAIHGNKSQGARTKALADFKASKVQVMVATDIAARGIDIDHLPHVVNYDLPHVSEDYVHRIGRTGRAGAVGEAVSLVTADEFKLLKDIERLTKQVIPRKELAGFEPKNPLPKSKLDTRPFKAKKPKKKKTISDQAQSGSPSDSIKGSAKNGSGKDTKNAQGSEKGAKSVRSNQKRAGAKSKVGPKSKSNDKSKSSSKSPQRRDRGPRKRVADVAEKSDNN